MSKWNLYGNVPGSKTRISGIQLWKRRIIDVIRKDESMYPSVRDYNFYTNGSATMSGKTNICFYYTIDAYPSSVPINYRSDIRKEAKAGVRVSFISTFEPTRIDWNSPQMKSKMRTWKVLEEESERLTAYNYVDNMGSSDSMERRKSSLIYLADADQRRHRNLFKYRTLMIVSGRRGEAFDKSIFEIMNYCQSVGLVVTRVDNNIQLFLRAFSPFSMELNATGILNQVGSNTLTDEQLARFSNYSQGKIGRGGIIFGTDIFSGYNVYKIVKKKDTDAENILITAETGGGKSYLLKAILVQLVGLDEYNGTINDIEGFEYIPFGNFIANNDKVVVLNMAEGQGCYYDPFEVQLTGIEDLDADMLSYSKSFTKSIMSVCIGEKLISTNTWAEKVISNAIARAYSDLGVVEDDPSTWERTKGYDLFYVYGKFKELYKDYYKLQEMNPDEISVFDRYKLNPGYLDALDRVVANLSEYFEPMSHGGVRANVFKQKVSLSDIVDAKLVINSFGMAGKSADTVDKTQMSLAQLSAANISYLRSIFSKAQGKFNFKVWEEFQRWGAFPGSATTIKTAITGGRKLGDINFIITNNVKELLDDDKFAIFDNITSFAIGAIASAETRRRVCNQLSVQQLQGELDSLVVKRGDTTSFENSDSSSGTLSIYDKAFLVHLDKSVTTIVKMNLPDSVASSPLFKTGVNIRG